MIGGALGGIGVLDLFALKYLLENEDPSLPASPCSNICNAGDVAQFVVTGAAIGAVVGYFVGGPRTPRRATCGD